MKFTDQQQNAINARNGNILVSAAAGSGKTAVLVERVKQLITDKNAPVNVDNLLVVTFTNAAAAEMKSRIASKLEEILKENPSDINALKQMSLLPCANICTIDSFCLNLVKENFFTLGISQDFTIIDNAELNILCDTACESVLDRFHENKDSEFLKLSEALSLPKDDSAFISSIKRLHNFLYAQRYPFLWFKNIIELYNPNIPFNESVWYPILIDKIKSSLEYGISMIKDTFNLLDSDDLLYDGYYANLSSDLDVFNKLIKSTDDGWNNIISAFKGVSFSSTAYKRNYESPIKYEFTLRRNTYLSIVKNDLKSLFCASEEDYADDMKTLYPLLNKLFEVVKAYDEELLSLKAEKNRYSFSDIEHMAINLLSFIDEKGEVKKSQLAKDLQNNFYEILIDEYQDTNDALDLIYSMLSNSCNTFMVGDVKQSIYRFRLAMPQIFISKRNNCDYYEKDSYHKNSKIILDKNFRSSKGICNYVNYIFSAFMSEKVGEIDYNKDEFLNYGADYNENTIPSAQIKILNNTKSADYDKNEATYIAKTIINKVKSGELIKDGETYRPIRYGDFAVLMRSVKNHVNTYNEIFTSFGIPVISENNSNLFETNEIKILLSLLRVIDNPMQDIPLLSLMMSPLYCFTADEMAQIKTENDFKNANLYTSVVNSKSKKVKSFLAEISMLGKIAVTMSVSSFIRYVCEYKNFYAFVNALGNGNQRCQNISVFTDFASSFDASDSFGLTAFMRFVDKVAQSDKGIEGAPLNPSSENCVSIMSIHRSKGLEFPVVILAGASRKYNMLDLSNSLLLNSNLGIGLKVHNEELLCNYDTIPYAVVKEENKTSMMSENLRVLYVAITRAKEQFITFITLDKLASKIEKLSANIINGQVNDYQCRKTIYDSDFILMSALMHQNGKKLREYSPVDIKTVTADFPLDIEIIDSVEECEIPQNTEMAVPDKNTVDQIKERLSFSYNNKELSSIPAKRTASSLDESIKGFEYFASAKPAFMNNGAMTPSEKGTAMHAFMQFCDYKKSKNNIEDEINRLTENGFITKRQADSLNRDELEKLFSSDFAKRMFASDKLYREFKVSSFVKISELENIDSDEEVLIQGISDCIFEENGELVLVDYKTDRVKNEKQLLDMYQNQIAFYKKAVSKALKKNVKEAVLYSFCLGNVCYYK